MSHNTPLSKTNKTKCSYTKLHLSSAAHPDHLFPLPHLTPPQMENSEMELLFLSFLLLLTLFLSISLRLMPAQHPQRRGRRLKPMQIGEGSKKRTPQLMNSSVLNSVSVSNESANIIIKSLKTGFRHLVQKIFPFYLQPWTRQESTRMGGLSLPWFLKPQILQNLEASCNLKEQVTVLADSDERHDRLIVATDLFPNDQKYENHGIKHFLTRFTDPFQDLLSGFSSMEMKLSFRSQDLSLHELTLGSKIHHSAGSPDLLRKILKGKHLGYIFCTNSVSIYILIK